MLKKGKYRAIRNIPIGWVLQALHSTDGSERYFRIAVELASLVGMYHLFSMLLPNLWFGIHLIVAFVVNHTVMWFLTGNFWVYMLDSFMWVKNPGIEEVIKFTKLVNKVYVLSDSSEAILIYGSMCRSQFHGRSDLDLRVVRRRNTWKGLLALPLGFMLRAYSFFRIMPVDLEVVDNMEFLCHQMRKDEYPIVVYRRKGVDILNEGMDFAAVVANPSCVLKGC